MEEFEGFRPRAKLEQFTAIPNELFDEVMGELSGSEFKILCAIFRKTYGWVDYIDKNGNAVYKTKDKISQNQFQDLTGYSKATVKNKLKDLIKKGYIVQVDSYDAKKQKPTTYALKQNPPTKSEGGGGVKSEGAPPLKFDSTKERSNKENKNNIYRLWEKILNTPIPNWQELGSYEDDFPLAVIEEALKRTKEHCDNQKWYYKYFKGILNNWLNEGVENMEDVDELDKQHEDKKNGKTNINPGGGLTAEEIVKEHGLEEEVRV